MPPSNDSDAVDRDQDGEPTVEPTVHELLLARVDEHCRLLALELDQVAKACEQLEPERARSCRNAITMASVMVDEIRLRAHARALDDPRLGLNNHSLYETRGVSPDEFGASPQGKATDCLTDPGFGSSPVSAGETWSTTRRRKTNAKTVAGATTRTWPDSCLGFKATASPSRSALPRHLVESAWSCRHGRGGAGRDRRGVDGEVTHADRQFWCRALRVVQIRSCLRPARTPTGPVPSPLARGPALAATRPTADSGARCARPYGVGPATAG
jgi:hypothetical protein